MHNVIQGIEWHLFQATWDTCHPKGNASHKSQITSVHNTRNFQYVIAFWRLCKNVSVHGLILTQIHFFEEAKYSVANQEWKLQPVKMGEKKKIAYPLLLAKPIRRIFVSWQLYKELGNREHGHLIRMCKLILSVGSHKQHFMEYPVDVFWLCFPKPCKAMQFNTCTGFLSCIQKKKKKNTSAYSNRKFKMGWSANPSLLDYSIWNLNQAHICLVSLIALTSWISWLAEFLSWISNMQI